MTDEGLAASLDMKYVIGHETQWSAIAGVPSGNTISVTNWVVIQLRHSLSWYVLTRQIVWQHTRDETLSCGIGPFETFELAVATWQIMGQPAGST